MKKIHVSMKWMALAASIVMVTGNLQGRNDPTREEVLAAMKKAAEFMVEKVSTRGGFLWYYSLDLSEQFGEVPARPSQVWIQGQGTPAAGMLFLEIYRATGEPCFLDYAKKAADVLVYGQHPAGGWHYFIEPQMIMKHLGILFVSLAAAIVTRGGLIHGQQKRVYHRRKGA